MKLSLDTGGVSFMELKIKWRWLRAVVRGLAEQPVSSWQNGGNRDRKLFKLPFRCG